MAKKKLTRDVIDLRRAGWSVPRIARHFDVTTVAVYLFLKRRLPHLATRRENAEGVCEICGDSAPCDSDHDHTTNENRGLLCRRCNQGLGNFRDRPELLQAAIAYLARYTKS